MITKFTPLSFGMIIEFLNEADRWSIKKICHFDRL